MTNKNKVEFIRGKYRMKVASTDIALEIVRTLMNHYDFTGVTVKMVESYTTDSEGEVFVYEITSDDKYLLPPRENGVELV